MYRCIESILNVDDADNYRRSLVLLYGAETVRQAEALLDRSERFFGLETLGAVCFIAYALDKFAARTGRWRISENTLLLLGLACGWPGAILAQQWLRHKSSKASFRRQFWVTVAVNIAVFVYLNLPVRSG